MNKKLFLSIQHFKASDNVSGLNLSRETDSVASVLVVVADGLVGPLGVLGPNRAHEGLQQRNVPGSSPRSRCMAGWPGDDVLVPGGPWWKPRRKQPWEAAGSGGHRPHLEVVVSESASGPLSPG